MTPQPGVDPAMVQPPTDDPTMVQPPTDPSTDTQPTIPPGMSPVDLSNDNVLAMSFGQPSEAIGFRDSTIGDFFGGGGIITGPTWGGLNILNPGGAGDRRYKLTEQTSPIPTNRVFFSYNLFSNALSDANGNELELNRYTFGFEKAFFNKNVSVELRMPMASGVSATQTQDIGGPPARNTEFGNMSLTTKALLMRRNGYAVSTGLGIILPTAAEAVLTSSPQSRPVELEIANEAYNLLPFFAVQRNTRQNWTTFYTQFDFATRGNQVTVTDLFNGGNQISSIYNDQNLMFLDLSMGHWFYQCVNKSRGVTGVAGILEFHYTTTLNDSDSVATGFSSLDTLSNPANRMDVLNTTLGLRFLLGQKSSLTIAAVAPLRQDDDKVFDGEFSVQFSRFGR